MAQIIGMGTDWNATLYRSVYAVTSGGGVQLRFKVNSTVATFVLGPENNDSTYPRLALSSDGTGQYSGQFFISVI